METHASQNSIRTQPLEKYGLARRRLGTSPLHFSLCDSLLYFSYSSILSSGGSPYWCRKCTNYVEDGSRHNHSTIGPVLEWVSPLQLMDAISEDRGQAVGYFRISSIMHFYCHPSILDSGFSNIGSLTTRWNWSRVYYRSSESTLCCVSAVLPYSSGSECQTPISDASSSITMIDWCV